MSLNVCIRLNKKKKMKSECEAQLVSSTTTTTSWVQSPALPRFEFLCGLLPKRRKLGSVVTTGDLNTDEPGSNHIPD